MVSVAQIRSVLREGALLASLELQDALACSTHPRYHRLLTFQAVRVTFQFTKLPFGLSLAPRVSTLMSLSIWLFLSTTKEVSTTSVSVVL